MGTEWGAVSDASIAAGYAALEAGRWTDARTAFESTLDAGETPDACLGLATALWWLGESNASVGHATRAYALYRQARNVESNRRRTRSRSSGVSPVGRRVTRTGRSVRRAGQRPVVRRLRPPGERTRPGRADQLDQFVAGGDAHLVDGRSVSALSANDSKSAEAFPIKSNARRVRASSASVRS